MILIKFMSKQVATTNICMEDDGRFCNSQTTKYKLNTHGLAWKVHVPNIENMQPSSISKHCSPTERK